MEIFTGRNLATFVSLIAAGGAFATKVNEMDLALPSVSDPKIVRIHKVLDEKTGTVRLESQQRRWHGREIAAIQADREKWNRKPLGALDPRLGKTLRLAPRGPKVRVAITLRSPEVGHPDKTRHSLGELRDHSRNLQNLDPLVSWESFTSRHGINISERKSRTRAQFEMTEEELQRIAFDPDVASITEERSEKPMQSGFAPVAELARSAYFPGGVPTHAGLGVRAATFETGLTSTYLNCIGVVPARWDGWDGNPVSLRHAQSVFLALARSAPGANLLHRRSLNFHGADDIQYIIDNQVQVLSLSQTRGGINPYRATYEEFRVMDDFAYRFPYPVFVTGTGNDGYQYEINWQGYNALSVGNVRHIPVSGFEMAGCTQARNPRKTYGSCLSGQGDDCPGDRQMPHLVAPGISSSGANFSDACFEGSGTLGCGTSYSAPVAGGVAAAVIASDSRLVNWPEKVRAVLIATSANVHGGHWSHRADGWDGAGVISGMDAMAFARNHASVSPNNTPIEEGMHAGSFYASDFTSDKRFFVRAPNPLPAGRHLRVVLTFDSNPVLNQSVNALSDLDLTVRHNGGSDGSYSWDGNVEIVDVASSQLTPGGVYEIIVNPVSNRIPANARTQYFYWALAWTWARDSANGQ